MHIVFLTSEYPKTGYPHGGVGTVVQNIARGLIKHKHKVSVVGINYTQTDEIEKDQGVTVYRLKSKNLKPLTWYFNFKAINQTLAELHQKHPIDVVESTELGLAFIQKLKGVRYLIRMHGGHHFFAESEHRKIDPWKGFQEKRSFKKADHVIGVSQYVAEHTANYLQFKNKYAGVIFNIANLERFYAADYTKEIKGRIFFAGSICEKKGIRQLVKALPQIKKQVPAAHLVIAGRDTKIRGTQDSYLAYLKTEIPKEVESDINFLGPIENTEIPKKIEKAEVCAYPSHMEALPLAWLEVLSMGKPFVGSNLGPGPEIVKDGETGLLCNPFQIDELAKQIIALLKDRSYARQLGDNAQKEIQKRFSYKNLIHKNINLYKSLI